jgi:hypothetical protein
VEVPSFLAQQFYVVGSLRNTPDGFELQARNGMGDGTLTGVGPLSVDGREIPVEAVSAVRAADDIPLRAVDVSRTNPIKVRKGDRVTLRVAGEGLAPGEHELRVQLIELNLGALRFSVRDTLAVG